MRTVVVPPLPGNFSALGLLIADVRRDFVRTRVSATGNTSGDDVDAILSDLMRAGAAELESAGFGPDRRRLFASLDMRYAGQSFELSVPVPLEVGSIAEIERAFADVYAARYGAAKAAAIEIVSYRLAAWGLTDKPRLPAIDGAGRTLEAARSGERAVVFGGAERQVAIFERDRLPPGIVVRGPALIEEDGSTSVVPPDWSAALDAIGCLVMRRS